MAVESVITSDRINSDPEARQLIEYIQKNFDKIGLDGSIIYYDFPSYSDYDNSLHKPDILILSPYKGIFAINISSNGGLFRSVATSLEEIDESLNQFCSMLIGRLLKSPLLRKNRNALLLSVSPIIFSPYQRATGGLESDVVAAYDVLAQHIAQSDNRELSPEALSEARSVIEGAKALTRPQKRVVEDPTTQVKAVALARLEGEIANFDEKQRRTALSTVPGPQRIRGLAGSGKTVILAMKAAHLHLANPDARILITFYTKSLRSLIEKSITRFYRHYKDEDPNWTNIHIRHGWGGSSAAGVYSDTCKRHGIVPMNLAEAKRQPGDPFDSVCKDIIKRAAPTPYYDYVLIDEGQDFPSGFYELCFHLTKGERDRKNIVWAYDELQNILNVKMRAPEELFGIDKDGQPRISLERSARHLPLGVQNDIVLSKCYRNQGRVLVMAHALGFGIYGGQIVQLLQDEDHWHDVGYKVVSGNFQVGEQIVIERPEEHSPLSLDEAICGSTVTAYNAVNLADEVAWTSARIAEHMKSGLKAEDIMVVALDDRNARTYFKALSASLAAIGIGSNNLLADPFNEPPFAIESKVTLSTVYRAKGNEAASVFVIGIDAIQPNLRTSRNKLFAAFTRSKAWLSVSGIGATAASLITEIGEALQRYPRLEFVMPDLKKVELIQRDLSERSIKAKKLREEFFQRLQDEGYSDDEIANILNVEAKNE